MSQILNIAAYRFVDLPELPVLRDALLDITARLGLRGTILLAPEGINLFLAGQADGIESFIGWMGATEQRRDWFDGMPYKRSWSDTIPFRRLRVRIKREIIRMDHPTVIPASGRAPAVDSRTLKRWLDAGHDDDGRPVVTLDTRNAFEVDVGAFDGAIDWRISKFTEFPQAVLEHRAQLEGKTVVSYCTGGIRCEKAAIYMRAAGIQNVWQLDGGILKYFEDTGGSHFHGGCFVFDERESLAPDLSPVPAQA